MAKDPRDALREAVQYQDLGKGLGPRLAKCLIRSTDDLLDRMGELVDRHAKELGGSPRDTALWLSSVWGPFDEAWLMQCAASLPEPARGRWVALLASPRFDRNISRRKAIAYASRMAAERLEHDALEVAGPPLGRVAQEASAQTAFQVAKTAGVAFSFSMPNEGQIERVLNSAGVSKQIKGFSQTAVKAVEDEVVRGMMAGSSIEDIASTIRKNTPVESMVRARRIARTMSTDCAAEAKLREYEEIGVESYTVVCTLDERTCDVCGRMDGKSFPVKGSHPRPAFHPNCRCIIREELSDEIVEKMTRSARGEDGKTMQVPASMTYEEWRKRFMKPAKPTARRSASPRTGSAGRAVRSASPRMSFGPEPPAVRRSAPQQPDQPTARVAASEPSVDEGIQEARPYRPKSVAGVKPSEPMGFEKADGGSVNPGRSDNPERENNCQSCVVAHEMRRRGYHVQAKPYGGFGSVALGVDMKAGWVEKDGSDPKMTYYDGAPTRSGWHRWMEAQMVEGGRYILTVYWKDYPTGHMVSAEKVDGTVRLYDPQYGTVYHGWDEFDRIYTDGAILGGEWAPELLRVDTLSPRMEVIEDAVEREQGYED